MHLGQSLGLHSKTPLQEPLHEVVSVVATKKSPGGQHWVSGGQKDWSSCGHSCKNCQMTLVGEAGFSPDCFQLLNWTDTSFIEEAELEGLGESLVQFISEGHGGCQKAQQ